MNFIDRDLKEKKFRLKQDSFRIPESLHGHFPWPFQGVEILESGQAYIWLEEDDKVEIDYDLAKFIIFALRLRIEELQKGVTNISSSLKRKLIELSNCHRTLLSAIGLEFINNRENDFGGKIIKEFFWKNRNRSYQIEKLNLANVKQAIIKTPAKKFPLCLNFFEKDSDKIEEVHSVIVLGVSRKGCIICFHKDGPGRGSRVELTDLGDILQYYSSTNKLTLIPESDLRKYLGKIRIFAQEDINLKKSFKNGTMKG
jgi:hypothetical protein